ncbi:MAG TPA: hypothetical protein VM536_00685, partial [Chloroflexia bacterium]|nr:hypothetical protein [Chloroflexia bacterium]
GGLIAGVALLIVRSTPRGPVAAPAWLVPVGLGAGVLLLTALHPTEATIPLGGAALGLTAGWWLERRTVGFEAPAPLWQQVIKVVIGLAGAFGVRVLLKPPLLALAGESLGDFLRYALIGLWLAWVAPLIFVRLFGRPVAAPVAEAA